MSAAERLVALFVAPPVEAPAPAAAERDPADLSPGGGGDAPEAVPVRSSTHSGGPRLRVVPVLDDDGGAEPSGDGAPKPSGEDAPEWHSAAVLAERHPDAPFAEGQSTAALAAGLAASLDACGFRVCVLGGSNRAASGFASALAARLARLPGARCAIVCAPLASAGSAGRAPGLPGPPAPSACRVARGLAVDGYEASVRRRVVELRSSDAPESVVAALAAARSRAPDAPTLTLLPGSRRSALDAVVGHQDLVLVIIDAGASSSLTALAVAELSRVAPGAVVRAVPLPGRLGAAARRAAVTRALDGLR